MTAIEVALGATAVSVGGITLAQVPGVEEAMKAGGKLSEMSAVAILGTVAILSLACVAYLIRLIIGKILAALEENTKASQHVADVIGRCEAKK
jgi:hypothetical protein